MKTFAINDNLAGVLALSCVAAVILAIALDANAGLGPAGLAGPIAAPGKMIAIDPGKVAL